MVGLLECTLKKDLGMLEMTQYIFRDATKSDQNTTKGSWFLNTTIVGVKLESVVNSVVSSNQIHSPSFRFQNPYHPWDRYIYYYMKTHWKLTIYVNIQQSHQYVMGKSSSQLNWPDPKRKTATIINASAKRSPGWTARSGFSKFQASMRPPSCRWWTPGAAELRSFPTRWWWLCFFPTNAMGNHVGSLPLLKIDPRHLNSGNSQWSIKLSDNVHASKDGRSNI